MKIAISTGLLLGLTQYAAAFPCTWNGGGSSYVYDFIGTPYYNGPCITGLETYQAQTTCCRCATTNDCNRWAEQFQPLFADTGNVCLDGDCYNDIDYWSRGCDLAAPQITIGDSSGGAALPAQWFTSKEQLTRYLQSTVKCVDDCIDQPSCNIGVDYKVGAEGDAGADRCANTLVTVTSSDWIGCDNQNTASKSFLVRYDEVKPTVTVNLGEFAYKPLPKEKLEQVLLTVGIRDNCDLNPEVTITVFSDEVGLNADKRPAAMLARTYSDDSATGLQNGWNLWLDRKRYAQKLCEKDFACQVPDGRYYVVRVCAKDQAGWVTCAEDSVGVPLKPMLDKKIDPINEGKLFIVAEDTLFWNEQPSEFGYRARNTGLNDEVLGNNPGRLCWTNRDLTGTAGKQVGSDIPIGPWEGSSYRCGELCQQTTGCKGYTYDFENIATGQGVCRHYSGWDNAAAGLSTTLNVYVLDDVQCPTVVAAGGTVFEP